MSALKIFLSFFVEGVLGVEFGRVGSEDPRRRRRPPPRRRRGCLVDGDGRGERRTAAAMGEWEEEEWDFGDFSLIWIFEKL